MKLLKFRVTNFRSVDDSGWIECNEVMALIGTNESGKTNLLIPLWKLNPAKDGEINPMADYPRKKYNEIRSLKQKPFFIEAYFELTNEVVDQITRLTNSKPESLQIVSIKRDFDRNYSISFPNVSINREVSKDFILTIMTTTQNEIRSIKPFKSEGELLRKIQGLLSNVIQNLEKSGFINLNSERLQSIRQSLSLTKMKAPIHSKLLPRFNLLLNEVDEKIKALDSPDPKDITGVRELILRNLPKFVYYSTYGNLDSEIYLPHVIENMGRSDLGSHEEAKVRTLRVLFDFVRLSPQEIKELGKDIDTSQGKPTDEQIKFTAEKKKERDILLQSAGTDLTKKFREWWKQGEYRFRFQADGDHFRIWVSDDKRPEDIELEGRSSGLQWFLSFYLIFLVESQEAHQGAVLLLDEPGLTLHPIAQKDLSDFFRNLATTNQIIYTTHSPFMVDPDQLDIVRAVYVGEDGTTKVSENLRAMEGKKEQSKSIYPVYAALGLSISDILMVGCQKVIVEGVSDQYYLSAIKNYLISKGLIKPPQEILFVPGGGVRGISAVVSILSGKDEILPFVILDADKSGIDQFNKLAQGLYCGSIDRILTIGNYTNIPDSEIEDLIPQDIFSFVVTRYLRGPEPEFEDVITKDMPVIPQVENYAKHHTISLEQGWKVEIAKRIKQRIINNSEVLNPSSADVNNWIKLFQILLTK